MTWRTRLPMALWLVVVWCALWGEVSPGNLVNGLLVAVAVLALFPLPGQQLGVRFHTLGLLRFVGVVLLDLVQSSLRVARLVLRPGPPPRNAVIAVPLRTDSDALLVLVANAVSLSPGLNIVEIDRAASTLYVHALGAETPGDTAGFREHIQRLEELAVDALGSEASRRALRAGGAP